MVQGTPRRVHVFVFLYIPLALTCTFTPCHPSSCVLSTTKTRKEKSAKTVHWIAPLTLEFAPVLGGAPAGQRRSPLIRLRARARARARTRTRTRAHAHTHAHTCSHVCSLLLPCLALLPYLCHWTPVVLAVSRPCYGGASRTPVRELAEGGGALWKARQSISPREKSGEKTQCGQCAERRQRP